MRAFKLSHARMIVPALLLASAATAGAQLANASTAATGLSGAFTARATGYNAVYWNPANLAMPGNPGFSFTLLAVDGSASLKPIDLQKIKEYEGQFVPASVREEWLAEVTAQGGQKGGATGGVTELGFSIGSFAFQLNSKASTDANLAPDAVEAILFGNAGRTGTVKPLQLAGSSFQVSGYSTGAVSFGVPLTSLVPLTDFAAGATVKYIVGHGVVMGLDAGSAINPSDINVNFPLVLPDSNSRDGKAGAGIGVDLGAAWRIPGFRFGVSLQNVMNTFKWDTTKFAVRTSKGLFTADTTIATSDSVDAPFSTAPAELRDKLSGLRFKPVFAGGVAFDWIPKMTLSADVRQQVGDGIEVGPKSVIAAGVEYRIIPFIPLRAGVSTMTGGFGLSGGLGIHMLGFELGVAGFLRKRDGGTESGGTLNLFSIRP